MSNQRDKLIKYFQQIFEPRSNKLISEWANENVKLPSETSEPGTYSWQRTPYQRDILDAISPSSPARRITLVFGSQLGKTTIEMIAMLYYIKNPRAQGFVFPDKVRLQQFIKEKFNSMLRANPDIESLLGAGMRLSGNTTTEKIYPGGFLHLASGSNQNDLMSWSAGVVIADEIDRFKEDVGGEGDPLKLVEKRTNTFAATRKIVLSSTPVNSQSHILGMLENSTYRKYEMHCPYCRSLMTYEWEYMHYETDETGGSVTSCWMECPNCGEKIFENSKEIMMNPNNGARWVRTNFSSPSEFEGFFLPSLYAPLGWLSWTQICQEYIDAQRTKSREGRENKLIAFYNTVLCRQYKIASTIPSWEKLYQRALNSTYVRGEIPAWVGIITTGADVQKNRIEVEVKGWGKRGRNILIDYFILPLHTGEKMEDMGEIWSDYYELIKKPWKRADGMTLTSVGNALDRSYLSDTIDNICIQFNEPTLFPIRGVSKEFDSLIPSRRESRQRRPAYFLDTPVDQLKLQIYQLLNSEDNEDHTIGFYAQFPQDLPQEYFEQLVAERYEYQSDKKKFLWVKARERNEALDTFTYNLAMYYFLGFSFLKDEQWDEIFARQKTELAKSKQAVKKAVTGGRRQLSSGLKI